MSSGEDYIILASNVKSFADINTISSFKTKLARRKEFPSSEDWRCAISEMTYKQSWYNVKEKCDIEFLLSDGSFLKHKLPQGSFSIDAGYYKDIESLIFTINQKLFNLTKSSLDIHRIVKLELHPTSLFVEIETGQVLNKVKTNVIEKDYDQYHEEKLEFIPVFGPEIENILGFTDEKGRTLFRKYEEEAEIQMQSCGYVTKYFENRLRANFPYDITAGFTNLYVYTNIVQQSDVGDAFAPILTSFPNRLSPDGWGGCIHHEPKNPIYRPVQMRSFDTIDIEIKDDSGQPVDFKLGNVVLKLNFQRYGSQ